MFSVFFFLEKDFYEVGISFYYLLVVCFSINYIIFLSFRLFILGLLWGVDVIMWVKFLFGIAFGIFFRVLVIVIVSLGFFFVFSRGLRFVGFFWCCWSFVVVIKFVIFISCFLVFVVFAFLVEGRVYFKLNWFDF